MTKEIILQFIISDPKLKKIFKINSNGNIYVTKPITVERLND